MPRPFFYTITKNNETHKGIVFSVSQDRAADFVREKYNAKSGIDMISVNGVRWL